MASGGGKKKLQKYCRIYRWLEVKDPALAEAIRDLCLEGILGGRGGRGVTFLYPTDEVRKQIVEDASTTKAEDAIHQIEAHVIPQVLRTSADFRKEVIGTRRGIKLEVESGTGASVSLKNGAKLKVASDFHSLKDNAAVWVVETGKVPLEGEAYVPPPRKRETPASKKEGGGPREARRVHFKDEGGETPLSYLTDRAKLATNVEASYDACMRKDRCRSSDPYLTHTVSLLNFLRDQYPDLLTKVVPLLDRDPAVSFYLLIEPYKTSTTSAGFLLENHTLFGEKGWNGAEVYEGAVSDFTEYFDLEEMKQTNSAEDRSTGQYVVPYAFRDAAYVRGAVDEARFKILEAAGGAVKVSSEVHEVYTRFIAENSIQQVHPVLPDSTIQAVTGSKKLWQDEIRFILHAAFQNLRNEPQYESEAFASIVRFLRFVRPGNDYSKESALSFTKYYQDKVALHNEFEVLVKFVNSTYFLYMVVPTPMVEGGWEDIPVETDSAAFYDVDNHNVYNAEAGKQKLLEKYREHGHDEALAVNPGYIAAVNHYLTRHGRPPPGLRGT
jgi:hypothetical protein